MPNTENNMTQCLIVDDEPMARDVLRPYIEKVPTLQLAVECNNTIDTLVFLQNNGIDLIFLEIRMPESSGTKFAQSLQSTPEIIFSIAFKEYALDIFELEAVDYLLRPGFNYN